jgi:hypothetical protein
MKGNIYKEVVKKMKRRESLKSEWGGSQIALEFKHEDKKKEEMVMTLSGRGKIILLEMEKFQRWIVRRDVEWVQHIDIFNLLGV